MIRHSDLLWFYPSPHPLTHPSFSNYSSLITSLRTPYVVCRHPSHVPHNALGWNLSPTPIHIPYLGTFDPTHPCNQLYLDPIPPDRLDTFCLSSIALFQHSTTNPLRIAFFVRSPLHPTLPSLSPCDCSLTSICRFRHGSHSFILYVYDNRLARDLDQFVFPPLLKWLEQFSTYDIRIPRPGRPLFRRVIHSPFPLSLPPTHALYRSIPLSYLLPIPFSPISHDPTLTLLGFSRDPLLPGNGSHRSLLRTLFNSHCNAYRSIQRILRDPS